MALSEATRALLAKAKTDRKPGEKNPAAKPAKPKARTDEDVEADGKPLTKLEEIRRRDKAIHDAIENATDSEFWFTIGFATPADRTRFMTALGLDPEVIDQTGFAFEKAAMACQRTALTPAETIKVQNSQLKAKLPPNILDTYEYTDVLPVDAAAEANLMLTALEAAAANWPANGNLYDSPHWFAVCFPSRQAKEDCLQATLLAAAGDKYLSGTTAARILNLTL